MKKTKLEKGITLVALIITIVVLLILAVVSIGAVKNRGIIGHASNVTSESTVAEEEEIVALAENEWKLQKNTPDNKENFENAVRTALKNELEIGKVKSVVNNGDGSLTITFSKTGNQYIIKNEIEPYTFTIEEISQMEGADCDGAWFIPFDNFWKEGVPEELKNSAYSFPEEIPDTDDSLTYNISCNEQGYQNYIDFYLETGNDVAGAKIFLIYKIDDEIVFICTGSDRETIDLENQDWDTLKKLTFTISMPDSPVQVEPTLNSLTIGTLMEAGTEVTGTDGGSYYDISVQDFNELIGQDILGLENFIFPVDKTEDTSGLTLSGFSDSETVYGVLRPASYSTDPYIMHQLDIALVTALSLGIKINHNLEPENVFRKANDPVYNFYLESGTIPEEGTFGVNLIIYTDDNAATENEKYFVRVAVGGYNSDSAMKQVYSKANIKENYPKVWNATLNVLSWKKVNRLLDKYSQ